MMGSKIADKLKTARQKAGISLRELARRTHVSPTHLSRIEAGDGIPSERLLRLICREIDADFDGFVVLTGKLPRDIIRYITKNPRVLERLRREMAAA